MKSIGIVLASALLSCGLQAILNATVGDGHKHGVHSLMLIGQHLFSGDRAGTLKVRHTPSQLNPKPQTPHSLSTLNLLPG